GVRIRVGALGGGPRLRDQGRTSSERRLDAVFVPPAILPIARVEKTRQPDHAVVRFLYRFETAGQTLALGHILQLARLHVHFGGLLRSFPVQNFFHQLVTRAQLALHEPEVFREHGDLQRIVHGGGGVHLLLERRQRRIAILPQPLVARLLHLFRQTQHVARDVEQLGKRHGCQRVFLVVRLEFPVGGRYVVPDFAELL